jgi:hypothetical protein
MRCHCSPQARTGRRIAGPVIYSRERERGGRHVGELQTHVPVTSRGARRQNTYYSHSTYSLISHTEGNMSSNNGRIVERLDV